VEGNKVTKTADNQFLLHNVELSTFVTDYPGVHVNQEALGCEIESLVRSQGKREIFNIFHLTAFSNPPPPRLLNLIYFMLHVSDTQK
jgi:hypothetical protein